MNEESRQQALEVLTTHRHGEDMEMCEYCKSFYGGILDTIDSITTEAEAKAWQRGYNSGLSNAMRRMSDEPDAPTTSNPFDRLVEEMGPVSGESDNE